MFVVSITELVFFTFQDLAQLLDVIVRTAIVDDSVDGEEQLGLDLRESIQDTLMMTIRGKKAKKKMVNQSTDVGCDVRKGGENIRKIKLHGG